MSIIAFYILILILLYIDLRMFGRKGQHEVSIGEALRMTAVWIALSMVFALGIYLFHPTDNATKTLEFITAYLIEKSLSMDNLFVFLMLFTYFGIERKYQHEVLYWGILGALILRSAFIFAGVAVVSRFDWVLGLFGLLLLFTGAKMLTHDDEQPADPSGNLVVRIFKRLFPVTAEHHGDRFFVRLPAENGRLRTYATPLFVALIVIETTDLAFAVDSIPAVFSVSGDPFIILTSNIFAILGLRALYFALAAIAKYFKYLQYGLGIILMFVGVKMLLTMDSYVNAAARLLGIGLQMPHIEIPAAASLGIIFGLLCLSMLLSVVMTRNRPTEKP